MVSRGYRKRGVGVSLLKRVKNPVLLAREMLVRGETDGGGGGNGGDGDPSGGRGGAQGHCQLSGEEAERLAGEWGLERVDVGWHWTRRRWEEHLRGLGREEEGRVGWEEWVRRNGVEDVVEGGRGLGGEGMVVGVGEGWDGREYLPQGTVGCVCLDSDGVLCVATSTGGLTNKLAGRIGDTPTLGAGFWAEEWEVPVPGVVRQPQLRTSIGALMLGEIQEMMRSCLPGLAGYSLLRDETEEFESKDEKRPLTFMRGVAMSGTGNGDSFLRLAGAHTSATIARFAPGRSLASAVKQIAGSGGELQLSAGDRWGKTGEGEGGIIGIEVIGGKGEVVIDFNCGGMFRAWIDNEGRERMMVLKEEY